MGFIHSTLVTSSRSTAPLQAPIRQSYRRVLGTKTVIFSNPFSISSKFSCKSTQYISQLWRVWYVSKLLKIENSGLKKAYNNFQKRKPVHIVPRVITLQYKPIFLCCILHNMTEATHHFQHPHVCKILADHC